MCTVLEMSKETGYSKRQIIDACNRLGIEKVGKQFVIRTNGQKYSIIRNIKARKPGRPKMKKNKK